MIEKSTAPGPSETPAIPDGPVVYEHLEPSSLRLIVAAGQYGVVAITLTDAALPEQSGRALMLEDLIDQVVVGLGRVQGTPFKSRQNALAITKLEEANHWLRAREGKP